ncbi:MAG: tRNA (N(6)-L-threonylcarbamoyladenosine(37)-C(2))-methylthiotransferase MtaB [Methylococcaceae bacterium]|nr:tRNA (N(6)-L-threonylcarbamoyladenosine(37)-C(2))-methylthiotransferase MtaB [Methylococcaceae bacterium]
MRVNLKTLGCRLNEAELETWARQLQADGHRLAGDGDPADLVIFNSCAVTADAVKKSRYLIRKTHRENPTAKLVVSGCYASLNQQEAAAILGVDLVVANADKPRLVEIVRQRLDVAAMPAAAQEPGDCALFALGRQRAFVKVQDGCRYRCTFCIVTVARGEERSRPIDEIVEEIDSLHGQGILEVVLTGVHLGGWGSDLGLRLEDLLEAAIRRTAVPRIRIGSLEPWELTDRLFELLAEPRVMPHLHLPLQSGCDATLRRMARRGRSADFAALAERARTVVPDLNLTTDIIVGFPGETEDEWRQSLDFIQSQGFGHVHIFSYSPRAGTKAATLPDPVAEAVKKARARQLQLLVRKQRLKLLRSFGGRTTEVLWEAGEPAGQPLRRRYFGYTPNYLKVSAILDEAAGPTGRIVSTRLGDPAADGEWLEGQPVAMSAD